MFAALIEKLQRRQDLTIDEAAAAMDAIMDGRATAGADRRPAGRARHERGAPGRDRRASPGRCGRGRRRIRTRARGGVRHLRHWRRPRRAPSTSRRSRRWSSPPAACASPSTATGRCRAAAAAPTCSRRSASTSRRARRWSSAAWRRPGSGSSSRRRSIPRCATRRQPAKELGVRTAFNLLGPLTNPAGATRQLVGVPRPELTELVARSLALLGSERAWVVHGADGLDEISTTGYTKVSEVRDGAVNTFYVHPSDFGLPKSAPAALAGGDASDNSAIARRVLAGERGAARDIVVLNAAAALLIAGRAATVNDGIQQASRALDTGAAATGHSSGWSRSPGRRRRRTPHDHVVPRSPGHHRGGGAPHHRGARGRGAGREPGAAADARTPRPGLPRRAPGRARPADHRGVQAPVAVARDPPRRLPAGRPCRRVCSRQGRRRSRS